MELLSEQPKIILAASDTRNSDDVQLDDVLDAIDDLLVDGELNKIVEEFQNDYDVLLELFKLCHDIYTILRNHSNEANGTQFVLFYAQVTPVYVQCEKLLNENPVTEGKIKKHKEEYPLDPYQEEDTAGIFDLTDDSESSTKKQKIK